MSGKNYISRYLEDSANRFRNRLKSLETKSRRIGIIRLFWFFFSVILFFVSFFYFSGFFVWLSVLIFFIVFGVLTALFNKIDYGIKKNKIWINIKEDFSARLKVKWDSIPAAKNYKTIDDHPFESDLNIVGRNSLLHLIDTTNSLGGRDKLHNWIVSLHPQRSVILKRQELIKELIPLNIFRQKLILFSNLSTRKELNGTKLLEWLNQPSSKNQVKKIYKLLLLFIPINILLFILNAFSLIPAYWTISLLAYAGIYWFNMKYVSELFDKSMDVESEFGKFSLILEFLENRKFRKSEKLNELLKPFNEKNKQPSIYFKKIKRITFALSFQKNPLTELLLNILFPWDMFFSYKLEILREEIKEYLPDWLEIYYELEALSSISNFAYLNPGYSFPGILEEKKDNKSYIFSAEETGHPLIPEENNVKNSFTLNNTGKSIIITGSNMSGKSTFLKTIGINLALAFAGAPVNALKLETKLFRIFTCIKVSDSVTDGISYFYAEVKRLKKLLEELKDNNERPVLYLIDEIFRGTNNLERLIGSRSYIKTLTGLNGTGLISTHDLELVKLEEEISSIKNYHFKEEAVEGRMIFDYILRKGPSPTTNALKIMKMEGLPVDN